MMQIKGKKGSENARLLKKALAKPSGGGGTALARKLGMPTADGVRGAQFGGDMGQRTPLPMIKSKTERLDEDQLAELEEQEEERRRLAAAAKRVRDEETVRVSRLMDSDSEEEEEEFTDDEDTERVMAKLREKRLAAMKREMDRTAEFRALGHGEYTLVAEDEFLPAVTKSKYVVCHFFHREFQRCKIVDKHLSILARKYLPTRFIHIDAEKTPFFVGKLKIKVLPTIVLFKDGVALDRIVGFQELGQTDEFTTGTLERRIAKEGIIVIPENERLKVKKVSTAIRVAKVEHDSDSDDGW